MRTLTLNPKQQREVEILSRIEAGVLDVETAAQLLGVGLRQLRRTRAQFRAQGMAAVVHGNSRRPPPNSTDPEVVERIVALAGHGRIEVRTLRASDELNGCLGDRWPDLMQVFQIERMVTRRSRQGTHTTGEYVYGLTRVPASQASPKQLLDCVQAHWHIENRSHWRRDANLGADPLQIACKQTALVLAALNCVILALFDHLRHTHARSAMRLYNAGPEQALALLCHPI